MEFISERNAQFAMMAGIYLTASSVLVWLGEDSELGDAAYVWQYATVAVTIQGERKGAESLRVRV